MSSSPISPNRLYSNGKTVSKTCHFFASVLFIPGKDYIILNPANIRLKDVFSIRISRLPRRLANTSWRLLEDVFWKISCKGVLTTSCRHLEEVLEYETLLRWWCCQDVFNGSWKRRNVCWDVCSGFLLF